MVIVRYCRRAGVLIVKTDDISFLNVSPVTSTQPLLWYHKGAKRETTFRPLGKEDDVQDLRMQTITTVFVRDDAVTITVIRHFGRQFLGLEDPRSMGEVLNAYVCPHGRTIGPQQHKHNDSEYLHTFPFQVIGSLLPDSCFFGYFFSRLYPSMLCICCQF